MTSRLAAAILLASTAAFAAASPGIVISHSGRLADGNDKPVDGQVSLTFTLYKLSAAPPSGSADDDTPVWTDTFMVTAHGGIYQVDLGSQQALTSDLFSAPRWLGIAIGSEGLSPRLRVGTAPYALHSGDSDTVGGKAPSSFAAAMHSHDDLYYPRATVDATFAKQSDLTALQTALATTYAKIGDSYLKADSDAKYAKVGDAYLKADADTKFALKSDVTSVQGTVASLGSTYAKVGDAYTKTDADGRFAPKSGALPSGALVMSARSDDPTLIAAGFQVAGLGRPEGWFQRPNSPSAASHVQHAAVIGTTAYIIGGHNGGGCADTVNRGVNNNSSFDFVTRKWTALAPLPVVGRFATCNVAYNGKVYVFGGQYSAGGQCTGFPVRFDVYDPGSNSWTSKTVPSTVTSDHSAGACGILGDGKLHVVSGNTTTGSTVREHVVYDFSADSWSTAAQYPASPGINWGLNGVLADGRLIAGAGHDGTSGGYHTDVWIYNPTNDAWTQAASAPMTMYASSTAVIGGRVHTFMPNNGTQYNYHYIYDPSSDSWSQGASVPYTAYLPQIATFAGSALLVSGWAGANVLTAYEYLDPLYLYTHP